MICEGVKDTKLFKAEMICLFLAALFIPFHTIHKGVSLSLFSMGRKLSVYPILVGLALYLYRSVKTKQLFVPRKYVFFVVTLFIFQLISEIHGLIIFPYWEEITAGQFDKLLKILSVLTYNQVAIDTDYIGKVWFSAKILIKSLPTFLCTYACVLWIVSLFSIDSNETIRYFIKGVIGSAILCCSYSLVEYLHLFGLQEASRVLCEINPLIYDVAYAHGWWPPLFFGNRVRSLFAEPSFLTIYLSIAIPVSFYYSIVIKRKNLLWKILPSLLLIMMLTTNSKTGMGILLAELVVAIFFVTIKKDSFHISDLKIFIRPMIKTGIWILVILSIGINANNAFQHRYSIKYDIQDIVDNHIIKVTIKNTGWITWNEADKYELTAAWYDDNWDEYGRIDVPVLASLHGGESENLILDLPLLPSFLTEYRNVVVELKKSGPYEKGLLASQGAAKLVLQKLDNGKLVELNEINPSANSMMTLTSTTTGSNQQRYGMMFVDFLIGFQHPWLGVGGNDLKQAYIIPNIPERLKNNREVQLWTKLQQEKGIFRSSFPVISEYPNQFATYGLLGLILFLLPSFYAVYVLWRTREKWMNKENKLLFKTIAFSIAYFGLMVSYIGGNTMQLYIYWIFLGIVIGWCEILSNECS